MGFFQIVFRQKINTSLDEAWDFFSSPENLKVITPSEMGFEVISSSQPGKMYPGMLINYRVKPFPVFRTRWVTEITHVRERNYFVDEQRVGPYALWHHEHIFEPIENGVQMTDIVSYKPPLGYLGTLANGLLIKKKLNRIFRYREEVIEKKFGKYIEDGNL